LEGRAKRFFLCSRFQRGTEGGSVLREGFDLMIGGYEVAPGYPGHFCRLRFFWGQREGSKKKVKKVCLGRNKVVIFAAAFGGSRERGTEVH
jgi:hypothetical protein